VATPLVESFGPEVPRRIASMVAAVHPGFDGEAFVAGALDGHAPLGLMARGRHWGAALRAHLPASDAQAIEVLTASLGPARPADGPPEGMAPFLYLPHSFVIAEHGLECLEVAFAAQHALTQRFTAEFCIRPFLERHPEATLARLADWTADPSARVRRLVSEGTRPRLPWAPRLRAFQRDPAPVLALLERLRDDPSEDVRRSVANNLNDIGKDHPEVLVATARRWMDGADPARVRLVRHALRSRISAGDPGALEALGFAPGAPARARIAAIEPTAPTIGATVRVRVEVTNPSDEAATYAIRLRVRFARPGPRAGVRVFTLGERRLAAGDSAEVAARISLAQHTTRTHHPGHHGLEVLVNGAVAATGGFELGPAA
jgi:3-methyladenine DNA glycosylase AlkC